MRVWLVYQRQLQLGRLQNKLICTGKCSLTNLFSFFSWHQFLFDSTQFFCHCRWKPSRHTQIHNHLLLFVLMSRVDFANEWKPVLKRLFRTSFWIEGYCYGYGIIRSAVQRDLTKALLRMGSVKLVLSVLLFWSKKIYSVCLLVIWIHITTISAANES